MIRRAAAAAALLTAACQQAEWIEYGDLPVPSSWAAGGWQATDTVVFRVVDVHGEPVAGADAFATHEEEHPRGGAFWSTGHAVSDADGFVQLRVAGGDCDLVVVRAPGFADAAESPESCDVLVLTKARPFAMRVVDWMGRPAAGEIGYTKYCGHRPDLEVAPIGPDGIVWLQRFDDEQREVYARCDGLGSEYTIQDAGRWQPDHPPRLFRLFSSPPLVGRVVDGDGASVADFPVGGASQHRGPWTATAADGSFRLESLPPDDTIAIDIARERRWLPLPARSQPCTLSVADARSFRDGQPLLPGALLLRCVRTDGAPLANTTIELRGFGNRGVALDGGGCHRFDDLPPGDRAIVVDGPSSEFESDEAAIRVVSGRTTELTLEVRARPRVRFVVRGDAPAPVALWGPAWSCDVSESAGEPIPVPCDGAAAFWIGERSVPLPPDFATRTEPIELVPPAPTIVGRLLDERGRPLAGAATRGDATVAIGADGRFCMPAGVEGSDDALELRGTAADGPVRTLPLALPTAADDRTYDVGDVRLWRTIPMRVLASTGAAVEDFTGVVLRDARALGHCYSSARFSLTDGQYEGPEPRAGDDVLVEFPCDSETIAHPVVLRLDGDGPWDVREPGGAVQFDVVDEVGHAIGAHLSYGRTSAGIGEYSRRLSGLAAGTHRFVFTAEGRRSCSVRISLADGEQRTLRVVLPALPAK